MRAVDEISKRLLESLRQKGHNISNENGASNAIIIAIAEAYGEGKENGIKDGVNIAIKDIKSAIDNMKEYYS